MGRVDCLRPLGDPCLGGLSAYGLDVTSIPPSAKQLRLLSRLATVKGQSYVTPETMKEASEQITRMTALPSVAYGERGRTSRAGRSRTRGRNVG